MTRLIALFAALGLVSDPSGIERDGPWQFLKQRPSFDANLRSVADCPRGGRTAHLFGEESVPEMTRVLACCLAVSSAGCASASERVVNPTTLILALTQANPGDVIRLGPGNYENVTLPVRDNKPAITIDAKAARVRSLMVRNTAGWVWSGGMIDSPPLNPPYGRDTVWRNVMIDNARRVEIAGVTLTGGETGVLVTRGSADITLRNNIATGLRSDGFNIATAKRVTLTGNTCRDFHPTNPFFDAKGKMLKDGTHPDCIMMWSEAGKEPTSDITIVGNRMSGKMQGIDHFYHPQLGRPPVYRVKVQNNIVDVTYWHGITIQGVVGADVRNNRVSSEAGAKMVNFPFAPIRTWLKVEGTGIVECGNSVEDFSAGEGTKPCAAVATKVTGGADGLPPTRDVNPAKAGG